MATPYPRSDQPEAKEQLLESYWRKNMLVMIVLLILWAGVSLGAGVVFADFLNQWTLPGTGYPLGFWFAQQGSLLCFLGIILIYATVMNRVDIAYKHKLHSSSKEADGR